LNNARAAGPGLPFAFTGELIQVGASIPRKVDQIVNVGDLFDRFSEKAVGMAVIE
jgi:hypothetical protein